MRIRLCVRRNGLPDANVLWPAVEQINGSRQKIADLLTAVNVTMPLESLNWTLEDYVVEVSGFECLHWQFLGDVLKDEDQVTIRPMEQVEVRARQLSGRHQISTAGYHLVDGVPFGTRPLRPLSRPSVVIPPRKRRRISTDETDVSLLGSVEPGAQLSIANVDNDEHQLALLNSGNATLSEERAELADGRPTKRVKTNKTVHFGDLDEDEDDDEDDGDFNDFEDASSSDSNSDSESDSDDSPSDSDSDSDSDSSEGEATSPERLHEKQEQDNRKGVDDASARPRDSAPPHMGLNTTRERNRRRQNSKRLAHLVKTGILPQDSNMEDLQNFLIQNGRSFRPSLEPHDRPSVEVTESSRAAKSSEKSKSPQVTQSRSSSDDSDSSDSSSSDSSSDSDESSSDDSVSSEKAAGSDEAAPPTNSTTSATLSNGDFGDHMNVDRVQVLHNKNIEAETTPEDAPSLDFTRTQRDKHTASYIISGTSDTPAPEHIASEKSSSALEAIARRQLEIESAPKRARLNLDGAKRMIFGNLGQRTPKSKIDEERVRAKLADTGKPKKVLREEKAEEEVEPESEAWRSKIKVLACECIDGEAVVLSEPPYPFVQRWDPQQQAQSKKKPKNKNKKRKIHESTYEDEYEGEYYEGDGYDDSILLNYDEEDASVMQLHDDALENTESVDDLPPLPADISTLPTADLEDLKPGTIITFKYLEMGKNFMPEMTDYRTAIVEPTTDLGTVEKGFLLLKLAKRDRKVKEEKKYDGKGNRVYAKFEMPMGDDEDSEEEDDGILETNFGDLVDARILSMARGSEGVDDAAARQLLVEAGDAELAAEGVESR